ncbi:uncharacterized protein TNCV_4885321 [Trichonephila clavipes]|nr:uncharacterized protein TNCV_4885321 [Trichonephila clavipes]
MPEENLLATRWLLATYHEILNRGQVTWTTPELAPFSKQPHQREDVSALDRFSVHRCPTRRVFNGTGLELVTKTATIRCLYHSANAATYRSSKDQPKSTIMGFSIVRSDLNRNGEGETISKN